MSNFNFKIQVQKTAQSNMGSDYGIVQFDGTPTVGDVMDWILERGEWGYIGIDNRGPNGELPKGQSLFGEPNLEYDCGRIKKQGSDGVHALTPYLEYAVQEISWSGSFWRNDYLIKVVQANSLPKFKQKETSEVGQAINEVFK